MSWILGIDTSSTELGIGLGRGDETVASYSRYSRNSHAEHIAQAVSLVLENNRLAPGDINRVAVVAGPGSFTGLRIGLAFVKGFCFGSAVRVLPLSSLMVMAAAAAGPEGPIVAAIDARRDDVFCARFERKGKNVKRETEDALLPVAGFKALLRAGDTLVTDAMGFAGSTVFNFLRGRPGLFPVEQYPPQRGLAAVALAAGMRDGAGAWQDAAAVLPAYLRGFSPPAHKPERAA
jgi:tRNA threonylcarbamoyl adenosine modification protein YeaZ